MKITQEYIARKAEITQGYLSNIISGKQRPGFDTAHKLFKVTHIMPELWLNGPPEKLQKAVLSYKIIMLDK